MKLSEDYSSSLTSVKDKFVPDKYGRVWLGSDFFMAPFGRFEEDYRFVINYLRHPDISKFVFHDNFTEEKALISYSDYLTNGYGWIGLYKKKRIGFVFLEHVLDQPLVYAAHGGLSINLFGRHFGMDAMEFTQNYAFNILGAEKLEGYILKNHPMIRGLFVRSGMRLEGTIKNRVVIDGKLSPIKIYGLTKEKYYELRKQTKTSRSGSTTESSRGKSKGGKREGSGGEKLKGRLISV